MMKTTEVRRETSDKLRINVADCTADRDKCVQQSHVRSTRPHLAKVKEVKVGGHQQIIMKKARTKITVCCSSG